MDRKNFLIGKGENLTSDVIVRPGGQPKSPPYSFAEAKKRLTPQISGVVVDMDDLPDSACPDDNAVATLTINPEYIAKSFYPANLLRKIGLEAIGSRPRRITPDKRSREREPVEQYTTDLFVIGKRDSFRKWQENLDEWTSNSPESQDLVSIESISTPMASEKVKGVIGDAEKAVFEVVLHTDQLLGETQILDSFGSYLEQIGVEFEFRKRFYAGGLCFLELVAPESRAGDIAEFTIVRAIRKMPPLRMLRPAIRSSDVPSQSITLPDLGPLDTNTRVAIFDGGIPDNHPITQWATPFDTTGLGNKTAEFLEHGVGVTSAFLFGSIEPLQIPAQPFAGVDHYRVLDDEPGGNPFELYEVLERIQSILKSKPYDFFNLSLGPQLPIEDDDVHAWTAVLDEHLSDGSTLATIAVGNDGESDEQLGLNRVQVPSDCVNAVAVGACDTPGDDWQRAPYSSVGPGRSPGLIKPDIVEFGGSVQRPFLTVDASEDAKLLPTGGTSFSAPACLRMGAGIRAHFGDSISTLAIRALLIHSAESSELPRHEIGWGRLARNIDEIVLSGDDTIRVIYQGTIDASKCVRAPIPLPDSGLEGKVSVSATICYATKTDPHHPGNYTRAGLGISFRPKDTARKKPEQLHANTKSFFGKQRVGQTKIELRNDAWKWENCLHQSKNFLGKSLSNPVFDIHYNSRLESHGHNSSTPLNYALIITVRAKKVPTLYNDVIVKYRNQLEQIRPIVDIPIPLTT